MTSDEPIEPQQDGEAPSAEPTPDATEQPDDIPFEQAAEEHENPALS